jgi:hypothetical protein
MTGPSHLAAGFELASRCLAAAVPRDTGSQPALPLPPLAGDHSNLTADELRAMAGLYFQAELEHAALIAVAEAIVAQRDQLPFRTPSLQAKLAEFERRQIGWYTRPQRASVFARVFGLAEGRDSNVEFERLFANFCAALLDALEQNAARPDALLLARLRRAGADLLFNLGSRRYGNTQTAGQLISAQLRLAVAILSDRELEAALGTHGLWASLRALLGSQTPDLGRVVTRAQTGLQVLNWLAGRLVSFTERTPTLPAPEPSAARYAAQWLTASGFAPSRGSMLR